MFINSYQCLYFSSSYYSYIHIVYLLFFSEASQPLYMYCCFTNGDCINCSIILVLFFSISTVICEPIYGTIKMMQKKYRHFLTATHIAIVDEGKEPRLKYRFVILGICLFICHRESFFLSFFINLSLFYKYKDFIFIL